MTGLLRKFVALGSAVTVQFAVFVAPFMHVHLDDHVTAHHAGQAMHAHLSEHAEHAVAHHDHDGLEFEAPDNDRAIYPTVFVAIGAVAFEAPAIVAETFQILVPAERPARRPLEVAHGHDPPIIANLSSRAPPSPLS